MLIIVYLLSEMLHKHKRYWYSYVFESSFVSGIKTLKTFFSFKETLHVSFLSISIKRNAKTFQKKLLSNTMKMFSIKLLR